MPAPATPAAAVLVDVARVPSVAGAVTARARPRVFAHRAASFSAAVARAVESPVSSTRAKSCSFFVIYFCSCAARRVASSSAHLFSNRTDCGFQLALLRLTHFRSRSAASVRQRVTKSISPASEEEDA